MFSSRDQQVLLHTQPQSFPPSSAGYYGLGMANLGVQPGSPYPVFALVDFTVTGYGRIEVWRCNPAGVSITGSGCSSAGLAPTIGVRRVETPTGDESRIVLGSAPPTSFAWCAVADAAANTFAGLNLPLALDPYGFTGCTLLVPADVNAVRFTGSTGFDRGYAEVNLSFPLVATGGLHFAAQWLVLDPATSGFAATPRCEFRVQ